METKDNYTKVEIEDLGPDMEEDIKLKIRVQKMQMQILIIPQRKMMGMDFRPYRSFWIGKLARAPKKRSKRNAEKKC